MKRVLITGSSSGLGLEIAKKYQDEGYETIGISRTKGKYDTIHLSIDFTKKNTIENVGKIIQEKYSNFSHIICCAGIGYIEKLDAIDYENSDEVFKVNIIGQNYLLSKVVVNIMNNNTDIVFLGATIGYKSNEFMPMYSATKRGLRGVIENRKLKLKNTGCRVLGIHPGGMNTESNIGLNGRETIIGKMIGKKPGSLIDKTAIAKVVYDLVDLPKNIEVSEIIINRK